MSILPAYLDLRKLDNCSSHGIMVSQTDQYSHSFKKKKQSDLEVSHEGQICPEDEIQRTVVIKKVIKPVICKSTSSNVVNDLDDLPSESDVSTSLLIQHKISKQFKCDKCNSQFDSESLLKEHYESHKICFKLSSHRVFICNHCGVVASCQNELNKHIQSHHTTCQKKTSQQMESMRGYECRWCEMRFADIWTRIGHERESHPSFPVATRSHKCQICSFEFTRASNLRSHILSVHANQVGKLVFIAKSDDCKRFKIEFDQDAINAYRENNKIVKRNPDADESTCILQSPSCSNTVLYIRDLRDKKFDSQQHMFYLNGKPVFIEAPKPVEALGMELSSNDRRVGKGRKRESKQPRPVIKIPYILAAAATSNSSHQLNKQSHDQQTSGSSESCETTAKRGSLIKISPSNSIYNSYSYSDHSFKSRTSFEEIEKSLDKEDYVEFVSMLKSKNDKLVFNPLNDKNF